MENLPLTTAIELLPPSIFELAASHRIRLLVIKGATLADQGLRSRRQVADVDVWVSPAKFDEMLQIMVGHGWEDRDEKTLAPLPPVPNPYAIHSVTLLHPEWPTSLDLHRYFPGFLASPQEVFDSLWSRREFNSISHRWCPVPARIDHWLLACLHAIRSRDSTQLDELMRAASAFSEAEHQDLARRAAKLGAVEPLRDRLRSLGLDFAPAAPETARWHREWQHSISTDPHGDLTLAGEFLRARGIARWKIIRTALIPPETTFRLFHEVAPGRIGLFHAYMRRWAIGVRHVPRLVRYVIESRRSAR